MKDYLKLAAIVALFILGSASDTYAQQPIYTPNPHAAFQQQHRRNAYQGQRFIRDHQQRYYNTYGNNAQRNINRQQLTAQQQHERNLENAGYRFGQWLVGN